MLLYIIRHGQPIYGPQEQLTHTGHKQARALVERLKKSGITKIYASPLCRARQTGEPTANMLGLPIHTEPWMSEDLAFQRFSVLCEDGHRRWVWDAPDSARFVMGENHERQGDDIWEMDAMQKLANGREGYHALMAESDEFLARHGYVREGSVYRADHPNDERIAAFCHHGFGVSWLSHLLRIPPHIFWLSFDISHTGVTVVDFQIRSQNYAVPRVLCMSDLSHLAMDDNTEYKYNTNRII